MERHGVLLDLGLLETISTDFEAKIASLTAEIYKLAGEEFNINSPSQLGPILFEKLRIHRELGVRPKKTKTGYSTDHNMLESLSAHPLPRKILSYRTLAKLKGTYLDALPRLVHPKTGRIHTSFNQTVTATGRLSSSDPNLQNIPIRSEEGRKIRAAFVPAPGCLLLSADYSQIELRILAHISGDEGLRETFRAGEDVHRRTALTVFGVGPDELTPAMRNRAKAINFGIIYGMGPVRLARETGLSRVEAEHFIEQYFEKYPGVKTYLDGQIEWARERGYVSTILGRRRLIPEIWSHHRGVQSNAERLAINTPIQGTAADLIKVAMVRIDRRLRHQDMKTRMILQVHDELLFEVPDGERETVAELVREEMEGALDLEVPLKADMGWGTNWLEAH
jgi:DNA polymerase-1